MDRIYKNDELLELTSGSYLIHDSSVTRFDIYLQDYLLCIDVYFDSIIKSDKQLRIHFTDIVRYQFLYSSNYDFYTVESYKFFLSEQGYYISLNPSHDEPGKIADDDEDLILCKNMDTLYDSKHT